MLGHCRIDVRIYDPTRARGTSRGKRNPAVHGVCRPRCEYRGTSEEKWSVVSLLGRAGKSGSSDSRGVEGYWRSRDQRTYSLSLGCNRRIDGGKDSRRTGTDLSAPGAPGEGNAVSLPSWAGGLGGPVRADRGSVSVGLTHPYPVVSEYSIVRTCSQLSWVCVKSREDHARRRDSITSLRSSGRVKSNTLLLPTIQSVGRIEYLEWTAHQECAWKGGGPG